MDQNFFSQNPAFQNISPEKLAFLMNFMNQEKPNSSRDMMAFLMNFVAKAKFYYPASTTGIKSCGTAKNRSSAANAAEEKIIPPVILHTILCAILLIISSYMQKD